MRSKRPLFLGGFFGEKGTWGIDWVVCLSWGGLKVWTKDKAIRQQHLTLPKRNLACHNVGNKLKLYIFDSFIVDFPRWDGLNHRPEKNRS